MFNPMIRGWINYYGRFYKSAYVLGLTTLNRALDPLGTTEIQEVEGHRTACRALAGTELHRREPEAICTLADGDFAWRLDDGSRMS